MISFLHQVEIFLPSKQTTPLCGLKQVTSGLASQSQKLSL